MPQLDFMIVADYVRAEGALLHMIAAGVDTIYTPAVPALHRIGVGIRLTMTPAETQYHHQIEIILHGRRQSRADQQGLRSSGRSARLAAGGQALYCHPIQHERAATGIRSLLA